MGVDTSTRGTIYYDDFESRRFSTISMLPDAGSHRQNPVLNTFTSQPDAEAEMDAFLMDDAPTPNTGTYTSKRGVYLTHATSI
jgi:hypothetical protein